MRKILVISLLLFLILPFYVSYAFFLYEKYQNRLEIKQCIMKGMNKSDLVLLKFSATEFESIVSSKEEFYYQGEEYDLVEVKEIGAFYHCWCWLDQEESDLNQQLSLLLEEAMGEESENEEGEDVLTDYFDFLYCYDRCTLQLPATCNAEKEKVVYVLNYSFSYSFIFIVPPEVGVLANAQV